MTMPPDVQPYAVAALPASGQSDTKVRFQVSGSIPPTAGRSRIGSRRASAR